MLEDFRANVLKAYLTRISYCITRAFAVSAVSDSRRNGQVKKKKSRTTV